MLAEDVTQEVFVSIHKKMELFDLNAVFKTWCLGNAVNASYNISPKWKYQSKYNKGSIGPGSYESKLESFKQTRPE